MQEWLSRRNISNFRGQLSRERSESRRLMLERLIMEEEARLADLLGHN